MLFTRHGQEHSLLGPRAIDFVILDDELLFQHLDRIQSTGALLLSKHDLAEIAFAQNSQEVEVVQRYIVLCGRRELQGTGWRRRRNGGCY